MLASSGRDDGVYLGELLKASLDVKHCLLATNDVVDDAIFLCLEGRHVPGSQPQAHTHVCGAALHRRALHCRACCWLSLLCACCCSQQDKSQAKPSAIAASASACPSDLTGWSACHCACAHGCQPSHLTSTQAFLHPHAVCRILPNSTHRLASSSRTAPALASPVPICVLFNLSEGLAGVVSHDAIQVGFVVHDLLGLWACHSKVRVFSKGLTDD